MYMQTSTVCKRGTHKTYSSLNPKSNEIVLGDWDVELRLKCLLRLEPDFFVGHPMRYHLRGL